VTVVLQSDVAATTAHSSVLCLRDLAVTFPGGVRALRGVSLDVAPGEIVGLVGESGSGKTVLGLAALGLVAPTATLSGTARLGETDMVAAGAEQRRLARRRLAGAVFQDPMTSLNPTMTVGRQVAEAAGSMDAAVELLERARVPEPRRRARQYPHQLSGGLRQRVMIAMAIAGGPALVVADEPTTALDVTVQAEILRLLSDLRAETATSILFVTHDLAVAATIADRIVVLYGGRLAEVGPTEAVLGNPDHPYTAALLASRLQPDSVRGRPLATLPGEPPDPRAHPPGCPFAPRCGLAEGACDAEVPEPTAAPRHSGLVACRRAGDGGTAGRGWLHTDDAFPGAAPAGRSPALRLCGLSKSFGSRRGRRLVVDDLFLQVPEGGAVALVGESGCGKTTTLRMAVGLDKPDAGTVELGSGGRPQLVFQDAGASLTPWLTVGELLDERLRAEGVVARRRPARIADALGLVGLPPETARRKPGALSGGQRQRASIARAVVVPPAFLACDEPISALDVSLAATVLNLLGRLRAELGMALLFVTHDLAAARFVADRVAVMLDGAIVEEGPADDVLSAPVHEHTRALVAAIPTLASN
jgi:peptide/nickel transport system ATP-binding protein